jgi:aspartyl aminopeptidase
MNRDINSGMNYNPQVDLLPLYSQAEIENGKEFMDIIAEYGKVNKEDILAHDLYLYVRESGRIIGGNEEYILSPKLDDLQCVYSAITALIQADDNAENDSHTQKYINMCVIFDNEEVGSGTKQGADSTFMEDVIVRIQESLGENNSWLRKMIADSMLISADNAHAVHPNHPEKSDPTNRPYVNGGIVIKYHGGQKYTTDAITAAYIKKICMEAKVPYQTFTNRADMAGGSTLGNISTAHVSIPSVDIGLPQLAMHSAVETGGVRDTDYAIQVIKQFFTMA